MHFSQSKNNSRSVFRTLLLRFRSSGGITIRPRGHTGNPLKNNKKTEKEYIGRKNNDKKKRKTELKKISYAKKREESKIFTNKRKKKEIIS